MKYAEIRCKNFRCKHNKNELCKIENEEVTENEFILK